MSEPRACDQCSVVFTPRRYDQRFHSQRCQERYRNAHRPRKPIVVHDYACDICSTPNSKRRVQRFSLRKSMKDGNRYTSRGVGTVFLCQRCWQTTAGQRRKMTGPRDIVEAVA